MKYEKKDFKKLGKVSDVSLTPNKDVLEKHTNPHIDTKYCVRFTCPEFTSICPITSQPDFARLKLLFLQKKYIVESKSLKLYLLGYRNHGAFHEDCTITIGKHLINLFKPHWFRISGIWYPRGGIPIDIFWQSKNKPTNMVIPELVCSLYKGRD